MIERKNDWVATLLNIEDKPELNDPTVLYANGITPDNTGIKDSDYYKGIPQVQNRFKKDDGSFDDVAFNEFYNSALRSYNTYSNTDFTERLLDSFGTSPYDISILSNPSQHVINTSALITNFYDRNRHSYGTGNLWEMGNANFSDREVAQANYVRDENGNILDWTPNDKGGLLKGLFRPALIYASWDQDGDEIINGRVVHHQKGELKLDANGDPYTELLGNRDAYGKDVVHYSDTITVEGTKLNRWDPFDSDGLDKSIWGTVGKTALTMAPFFISGVGPVMGAIAALGGIASSVPTLAKAIDGIITGSDDDEFGRSMTKIENFMNRFGSSQSDASRGRIFSAENIGDILRTSAGQLFSQRVVGAAPTKIADLLGKSYKGKKLGQQLSLGYMALTSATDSYGSFKEAGASDALAGIGMLATIGGFWGLMNTGYFKDKLFEGTLLDEEQGIRRNLKDIALVQAKEQWGTDLSKVTFKPGGTMDTWMKSDSNVAKFLANTVKSIKEFAKQMPVGKAGGTENAFISRMINEGVEEWMEEVMQDSVKGLAKGLEALGMNVTDEGIDALDFGIDPEEMMKRWASSFVGGALGGATFELFNQMELLKNPQLRNYYKMPAMKRMAYDLQDPDNLEKYISTIKKMGKHGQLGNKNLSATDYESVNPVNKDDPNRAYKSGTPTDNQNLAMQNFLIGVANNINYLATTEGLVQNSEMLIRSALTSPSVQEEVKKSGLSLADYWKNNAGDVVINTLYDMGMFDSVLRDARSIGVDILQLRQDLDKYEAEKIDEKNPKNAEEARKALKDDPYYKALSDKKKALEDEYKEIISGKRADKYVGFAHMMLDKSPMVYLVDLEGSTTKNGNKNNFTTVENFAQRMYHLDYNSLTGKLKNYIDDKFEDFMKRGEDSRMFWNIYNFYEAASDRYAPNLKKIDSILKDAKIDPFHGSITVGQFIQGSKDEDGKIINLGLDQLIAGTTATLQKMAEENPEVIGTQEYTELLQQLDQYEKARDYYASVNPSVQLSTVFDWENVKKEFGESDFTEGGTNPDFISMDDESINTGIEQVKRYYNYLKDNKVISSNLDYLAEFFRKIQFIPSEWYNRIKSEFQNPNKNILQLWAPNADLSAWDDDNPEVDSMWDDVVSANPGVFDGIDMDDIVKQVMEQYANPLSSPEKLAALSEEVSNIQALLRTDPSGAKAKYNDLLERLKNEVNWDVFNSVAYASNIETKYDAETFLNELVFPNGKTFIPLITEVESIVDSSLKSPLNDLLQDLSITVNGEKNSIFEFINGEREKLKSIDNLDSYVASEEGKRALKDAQVLLNMMAAIIDGSQSNLNAKVNEYRKQLGKAEFAVISDQTAQILKFEIEKIQNQLNFLMSLAGMNLTKNLTKQQDIMRVDTLKRVKFFVEPPEEYRPIVIELANILGGRQDYFEDIWNQGNVKLSDVTEENFDQFNKERVRFESRLYADFKAVANQGDKIKTIVDVFSKLQSNNASILISANAGVLTDDPDVKLTPYGMLRYLGLVLSADTAEILSYYKQVNQNSKYIPLYPQELIIRDAWATFYDPYGFYNSLAEKSKEVFKTSSNSEFIKEADYLDAFLFINGVPGAGKTAVIANTIKKMIRLKNGNSDKTKFVSISMTKEQTDKLANAIEEPNSGILWEDALSKIKAEFKNIGYKHDHQIAESITTTDDVKALTDSDVENIVFFFDEITLATELQLKAWNQYINKLRAAGKRVITFGLGDLNQPSAQVDGNEVSMTNLGYQASFRLTASFRETNEGKYYNTEAVYGKVNAVQENLYNNKEFALGEADKQIKQSLEDSNISLQHYDSGSAAFGDFQITKENVKNTVEKLKGYINNKYSDPNDRTGKIAIVVNDQADKEKYERDFQNDIAVKIVELRDILSVQGGEFDYVIGDANLEYSKSAFQAAKRFYMLMSRARNATFFTEASVLPGIRFDLQDKASAGSLLKSDNDDRQNKIYEDFRNWWMNLYSDIRTTTPSNPTQPTPQTGQSSSPAGPTSIPAGGKAVTPALTGEDLDNFVKNAVEETTSDKPSIYVVNSLDKQAIEQRKSRSGKDNVSGLNDLVSTTKGDADGEVFSEFLETHDLIHQGLSIVSEQQNPDNDMIAQVKEYINYAASYIRHHKEGDSLSSYIGNGLAESNLFADITAALENAINAKTGFYYLADLDDKHSVVYYVFPFRNEQKAIPVSVVNGKYTARRYKTLNWKLEVAPAILSSRGKRWTKLSDVARGKVSVLNWYASFLGDNGKSYTKNGERFLPNKGKTFQFISPVLSRNLESNVDDFKGSLSPIDERGNRYGGERATGAIDWWFDKNTGLRQIGVQKKLDFDTFRHICHLISVSNGFGQTDDIEKAKQEIEDFFDLERGSYIPVNSRNISEEQWEKSQSEDDGSEVSVKRTTLPLLGYDSRPKFMRAFIQTYGDSKFIEKSQWGLLFQTIKPETPTYTNRFRIVRFNFEGKNGLGTVYLKCKEENGLRSFVVIDPSTGQEKPETEFKISNITPDTTLKTVLKEIVTGIQSVADKSIDITGALSAYGDNESPDTENWTNVLCDFEDGGTRKDNSDKFSRFRESISVIMQLAENMSRDSDKMETFKTYLDEYFKYGYYIELKGKEYLNFGEGNNNASWAITQVKDTDDSIVTDVSYILAPIFSIDLDTAEAIPNGTEIKELNTSATADPEIKGDRKYTKEGNQYIFKDTWVNRDWVRENAKNGLPDVLNTDEKLYIRSGQETNEGFELIISRNGNGYKVVINNPDSLFASVNEIIANQNLGSIGNGIDFVVSEGILKLQLQDGSLVDADIVGVQDNLGVFYKLNDEIRFVSGTTAQNILGNIDIASYINSIKERGYALGDINGDMLYIKYDNGTPTIELHTKGNTFIYRSSGNKWVNGDNELQLSETVQRNLDTYIKTNKDVLQNLKDTILKTIENSLTGTNDWALDLIRQTNLKEEVGKLDSPESVVKYINDLLYENRFLSSTGLLLQVILDKELNVILGEKEDDEVIVGNQIITQKPNIKPEDIKQIKIEQSADNSITYYVTIGNDVLHQRLVKDQGKWSSIQDLATQDAVNDTIQEKLSIIQDETARTYFTRYFEGIVNNNPYKQEAYITELSKLSEAEQDAVINLQELISEDIDCFRK